MSQYPAYERYSGIWNLAAALQAKALGTWPVAPEPVYQTFGSLYSWGSDGYGQLGNNTAGYHKSSPVQVGGETTWGKIAAGEYRTLAIKSNGTLWAWGRNNYGQLGLGFSGYYTAVSSPVQVGAFTTWSEIESGDYHNLAIYHNGTLWAWGKNSNGQLGDGTTTYRSAPVQIGALANWLAVAAGSYFSLAIKTNGTLWAWGHNNYGQLGLGNTSNSSSPVQVGALTNWSKISCAPSSGYFVIATKTDGTLWSWGQGQYGVLGLNMTGAYGSGMYSSPKQVGALTTWDNISCGSTSAIAVKSNGTLWSWGANPAGQLGDGTTTYRSSPVQVGALTNWSSKIGSGTSHFSAIKTDGTLWSWGANIQGVLGHGHESYRSSPVQVGALTTWVNISSGFRHSHATAV